MGSILLLWLGSSFTAPCTTAYITQFQPRVKPDQKIQVTAEPKHQPHLRRNKASSAIQLFSASDLHAHPQPQSPNVCVTQKQTIRAGPTYLRTLQADALGNLN